MAESPTILVIGPRWVGDMVMAQCLFSALKELHPNAAIDVLAPAWAAPLVKRMPQIRQQIDFPLKPGALEFTIRRRFGRLLRGRYDMAYILPGSWKSALIPFFAHIPRRFGHLREMRYGLLTDIVPLPDTVKRRTAQAYFGLAQGGSFQPPRLTVDAKNQAALLDRYGLAPQKFVALMPGAEFGPAKRWPSESYAGLARDIMGRGLKVALFGSKNDRDVTAEIAALAPGAVDLAGQTRLEDAIDLISAARLAVSNDSGLMHVAAGVGTPIVAVYGSTSPENTPPLAERRELVWLGLSCSPCHQKVCPLGHLNCLKTLEVGQVAAAVERLLEIPGRGMKVLIVKTSSMGDVIHTFPAVEDALRQRPDVSFDWCVEEAFAGIVALHPAIGTIHTVAIRRWRKALLSGDTWREAAALRRTLRACRYDLVIDAQGLLKSAVVARQAAAPIAGFDKSSAREPSATLFYDVTYAVPRDLHAIERTRRLFGLALGYQPDLSTLDSGIVPPPGNLVIAGKTAFLLHGTSREDKKWPAADWIGAARLLVERGMTPVTTWSNESEKAVAEAIAKAVPPTVVVPRSPLADIAAVIGHSSLVIGADTGLAHLASAFGLPTVAVFLATEPGLTGPRGPYASTLLATHGRRVTPADVMAEAERLLKRRALDQFGAA